MPKIEFKRGTKDKLPTLAVGEPAFTTDTKEFFIGSDEGNIEFAKQNDLNTTNANVTNNTNTLNNLANVSANAEVMSARGTYPLLGNRLDGVDELLADITTKQGDLTQLNTTDKSSVVNALKEIKTQANTNITAINANSTAISNIGNGSPKGTYATLTALQTAFPTGTTGVYIVTADGKWYYWSGSAWTAGGVYQATSIPNGSVTQQQLNFVPVIGLKSKNLFNKATVTTGKYVDYTSGGLPSNSTFSASDYIPVSPSTTYYKNSTQQWAYYDVNKTYISGVASGNTLNTPANASYVRISATNTELDTLQLELGNAGTSYQSFNNFVDPATITPGSLTTDKQSFFDNAILSNNLYNSATITTGKYVNYQTGALSTLAGYNASDYIPVTAGSSYIKTFGEQFAFYDSNKVYVSGLTGNSATPFTIPANVFYARFSIQDSQLATFQVNKGNSLLSYDTFSQSYRMSVDNIYRKTDSIQTIYIVDQSGRGHYKKINDAVLDIKSKGYTQKITLHVMPGTYEEVVKLQGNTNISIVGVNKKDCILIDKSGDYVNSPIQISGEGYISNMTIVATHDNNPSLTGITTFSYAVHHDYAGVGKTVFENCRFESYQNAAVGIGMHQSQTLKFRNCEFYKDGANYDGGSLYFHNQTESGVTNQLLIVENCDIRSIQGRAVSITDANIGHGDGLGNDMTVEFINTMAYSEELGKACVWQGNTPTATGNISGYIKLGAKSYGNNIAVLNA